jgi:hypothetical protein
MQHLDLGKLRLQMLAALEASTLPAAPRPMTLQEAKLEAVRRWGPDAVASYNFMLTFNCEVFDSWPHHRRYGCGATFEEAFAKAGTCED